MNSLLRANAALLFAGVATFVLMGAGQSLYGPALPAFARDLGLSVAQAGWLVSAHWIGCFIGVAGMFAFGGHVGPRIVLAIMAAGALSIGAGLGLVVTFAGAVIFGAGYGAATVVFNPRILWAFGAKGTAMLSLLNATFGIGAIAAPLAFVALGNSPSVAFALVGGLCLLIWLSARASGSGQTTVSATSSQTFRPHWPSLCFGMIAIGTEACLIGLGPTALIEAGKTETHAAQLLSAFFVAFLGARVVLIFTAHLMSAFALYILAVMGAGVSAAGVLVLDPGLCFILMGICAGVFFPSFYVMASERMGHAPRVAPTIIAAGLVGGILAPVAIAPFMGGGDHRNFFYICSMVLLATASVALAARPKMKRAAA